MKKLQVYFFIILSVIIYSSCDYEFPEVEIPQIISGSADFSKFITIGNSFTSGFMDGALYNEGQANSFPAIIAGQLLYAGGSEFIQPDINSINGYNENLSDVNDTKGKLIYMYLTQVDTDPVIEATRGELPQSYDGNVSSINNFGVPGLKSFQVISPLLSANIYYNRFASDPGTSTLLDDFKQSQPTFFSLWIGISDFMNYALSGGVGEADPLPDPALIEKNDMTPVSIFENVINQILEELLNNSSAKGVLINLPGFSDFPYFNTYNYNCMTTAQIHSETSYFNFNNAVADYNLTIYEDSLSEELLRPYIDFNDGDEYTKQSLVIEDETLVDINYPDGSPVPKIRQLYPDEYVLLSIPYEEISTNGLGSLIPVPAKYILTRDEITKLEERISAYNNIIYNAAQDYESSLVLIDLNSLFYQLTEKINEFTGEPISDENIIVNGVPIEFNFDINGFFSLDAIHPNQKANAFLANIFINAVNQKFGSNIPTVNVNSYKGNPYVNVF